MEQPINNLQEQLTKAIQNRINELIMEEANACVVRIKVKLTQECVSLAPTIISKMNFLQGNGELIIRIGR